MGFSEAEASIAMKRCGSDSSITKLTDFICAAQMANAADTFFSVKGKKPLCNDLNYKKRRNLGYDFWERNKQKKLEKKLLNEDDHAVHLLIPMTGSVVPTKPDQITQRTLPEDAIGSSYFYYDRIHLSNSMIDSVVSYQTRSYNSKNTSRRCYNSKNTSRRCYEHMALVPLESDEVEMLLGFSRINDTEVAFYGLGILLKTDVQELNDDRLEQLMSSFNGLDLVVGGIQCNNLTGRNKHHSWA
ncbi:DEAD-box ATP-dependent RNA helicase 46 isoform 1 [Hibiscus syriacus]|uniref:DEAD-box ATP-dependent RNA helicase 46 isoform 1 n=1 Tax=Hibiscus syriacus TaxID=106335 RepID=A0A6A3B7R8_HIBSY|nr:DEAD-box ATP-dependent RNA helicase 46 isoform 1 [Hibiscus syriacus]